ncbi:NACHT domain-containing protein [Fusarium sp. LHS14.1]|nr:NACHT domain-containing protein [Fusarium sp. LHS14.1]
MGTDLELQPLRQLYPNPENTAEDEATVDIVAVHGLNPRNKPDQEHAWDTWRTPAGPEGRLWLRDELPKELPYARIFLYEYNSTAVYGKDRTTFIDKVNAFLEELRIDRRKAPRRPLLLLGHSLGGLLIKQSLINAHNNEKYEDIKDVTQGLAFFATPHDGGKQSLVNIGKIAAKIALELGFQRGDNILETLKSGSMFSDLMHEHWRHRLLQYPIVSFWGAFDTVVPRESTSFGLPGKHVASHGGVCKFGTSLQDRDNFKLVQANIQDLYDSAIRNDQDQPENSPKTEEEVERAKQVAELLRNLYKSVYSDAKYRNPQRVQGTCEWFTSHDRFQDWKDGKTCGLLWVSADPGCGKSVLTRYLVDEVLQSSSHSTICYFFFKDDFQDQKSAAGALCCLLRQIFRKKPGLLNDAILKQYDQDGDKLLESFRKLWRILVSVSKRHRRGQIVCILDALDECEEQDRHLLVEILEDFYLTRRTNTNLKFLVTSRPYVSIERGFHDIQTKLPVIRLQGEGQSESEKIAREIDLVVEARITQLCEKLRLARDAEKVMKMKMTQHTNRTYLWVYLVFGELENCVSHSPTQIKEHIGNIPETVEDAYEKILSRSPDNSKARKLLHMVLAAKRPLRLKEMAAAMTMNRKHTSYSQLDIGPKDKLATWVRDACGLFVSILGDKIYLLHQTAAEFLVDKFEDGEYRNNLLEESNTRSEWKGSFSSGPSNLILGSVCAQILLLTDVVDDVGKHVDDIENRSDDIEKHYDVHYRETLRSLELLDQKYPLLSYSIEHWAAHLRDASSTKDLPLSDMLQLCSGSESTCLFQVPRQWDSARYVRAKDLTALVTASILGLEAVTRHLLEQKSIDANQRDPILELPPLSWAVRGGQKAVFDTFIEAEERYQKTVHALKRIFRRHYVDLDAWNKNTKLRSLWKKCARRKDHSTSLEWAVCFGEMYMVEKLLATRHVTVGKEMLQEATMDGNKDIMRALLATGQVAVDCRDSQKRTPLSYAAEYGHESIVRELPATGKANINSMDHEGQTPLHCAAERGHEGVVQQLLATGKADVNSRDRDKRTPLSYAAEGGHERVMKQLLATGKVHVNSVIDLG